ncbi:MAG: tRNA pseudouridine(55) synthase TruB [Vicinamibacteraceae bacterium]
MSDLAGLLVVDKPEGPTSHDVVGRVRRVLGEKRVGHAGTLDPLASGVVVVVVGRATRLSPYLTSDDKRYRATLRLGVATTTYDRQGDPLAPPAPVPADLEARLREALDARLGTQPQTPPAYSAKKIDGERAHRLARRGEAVEPAPALVTLKAWTLVAVEGDTATIDLHTSAGFYVRSLAHDVGAALGCGGHLAALRRTGSGRFTIEEAVPLPAPDAPATSLTVALRSIDALLPEWPAAVVTAAGAERVSHGSLIGQDVCTVWPDAASTSGSSVAVAPDRGDQPLQRPPTVKLLDETGRLLALAVWRDGRLHPSVVLV